MKILYAYDFDGTMIPYDSFRRYLWHLMKLKPVRIGWLLMLRKMRLLSAERLKERVTRMVTHSETLKQDAKRFAKRIVYDVQMPVIAPKESIVLIISASPDVYMRYVAEALACELLSSSMQDGTYVEMYGETKKTWIKQLYPKAEYVWTYAASDSASDECWMKEFKQYEIIDKR